MSFLGPTEEQQVEQVAYGLNVSPGDIVRRMITVAFGGSEQDQEFLDTLRRFRHADEFERSHLAPVLRGLVVHAPQTPALDASRMSAVESGFGPPMFFANRLDALLAPFSLMQKGYDLLLGKLSPFHAVSPRVL